jgi:DNA repair exonuclease SbcCD nuclease subunit
LRQERFNVVRRIGDLAASENVDAVLVAGDVFGECPVDRRK